MEVRETHTCGSSFDTVNSDGYMETKKDWKISAEVNNVCFQGKPKPGP